ncbi:MAG: sugar phosphate isomerase/epimerase [Planctomycetaceae bacterium]|nr:sugar phosphate isomerase/epimerase [Planctomycetaceae bacterium]
MSLSRRNLLRFGLGAAALSASGLRWSFGQSADESNTKKIPIGLQLYSLRTIIKKDVPGTLKAVAAMGYQGVEFAGYFGMKAPDLRKLLDDVGLKCCGTHTRMETLSGDQLKQTVEYNQILGNPFLIVPSLKMESLAVMLDMAKKFTALAEQLKPQGLRVGYHAHQHDFKPVADRIPWDVLFTNAGPDVVMQLDVGNCLQAGVDPVAVLKNFPHRSATVHLKEFGGPKNAAIGQGDVPWSQVFEACETIGDTQWYVVEHESGNTPMESVKLCLENLRKMGK